MPRDRQNAGFCPKCGTGEVSCTYNRFETPTERIDSWEHRCLSCSFRETKAFKCGEGEAMEAEGMVCPFCGRKSGV
jgi:hypothetical protein